MDSFATDGCGIVRNSNSWSTDIMFLMRLKVWWCTVVSTPQVLNPGPGEPHLSILTHPLQLQLRNGWCVRRVLQEPEEYSVTWAVRMKKLPAKHTICIHCVISVSANRPWNTHFLLETGSSYEIRLFSNAVMYYSIFCPSYTIYFLF